MHKLHYGLVPNVFNDYFSCNSSVHEYNTRLRKGFLVQKNWKWLWKTITAVQCLFVMEQNRLGDSSQILCSSGPRFVRMASGAVFISRLIWFWVTLVVLVVYLYHVRMLTGYSALAQLQSAEPWIFIYNWPFVPCTCDVICSLNKFCKRQPVLRLALCKPCSVYHQHQRHTTPTFHVISSLCHLYSPTP